MSPDAIDSPGDHSRFPWWLFGFLVTSPASVVVGLVLGALVVWQRKRLEVWAWKIRGRFR